MRHWATGLCTALAVAIAAPASAQQGAGDYLAARSAAAANDFANAAVFFTRALGHDPGNLQLLDSTIAAHVGLGQFERALGPADRLVAAGGASQFAFLVRQVEGARRGDWTGLQQRIDGGESIGPLVDGLARAWALVGEGRMSAALDAFDAVIESRGLRAFGLYHKALALAAVGDLEGAEAIFALPPTAGMQRTRRSTLAEAEVLARMGRTADAVALLDAVFGPEADAPVTALRDRISGGETLTAGLVPDAQAGIAEAYLSVAGALDGETADSYTLAYARAALALRPDDVDSVLLTAALLERLGQYGLADETYRMIDREDPAFASAETGRAEVLRKAGRIEAATEVLRALARSHPDMAGVHLNLGNILRDAGDDAGAEAAYTTTLGLLPESDGSVWLAHYLRGVVRHRQDDWPGAEADFRAALALQPDHPQVLNYLGYSLVERNEQLDEALGMIERAVAQRPDNGAIVDSLGWVLFRLGQYGEAVTHLERAAELEPMEAVINDHLGDAFWAVGRLIEAEFQWNRALSLSTDDEETARIRRKLEIGLDAVLAEEGAAPLIRVAGDDG